MNNVRDTIWANYKTLLTANPSPPDSDKEVYIRLTQGVDYQFSEDPTAGVCEENGGGTGGTACFSDGDCNGPDTCDLTLMPRHSQSLYDEIIDLIDNVGVDKIIISEYFVGHSRMMNEDMGRMSAQHALEDSMDPSTPIIYAPDRILIGEVDYPRVDADYVGNYIVGGHYTFDEVWTGPAYVAGNFFNNTLSDCLANNTVAEINALITGGAGDIAVFLSGHGTPNTLSGAYDSLTDTPHFNTKVWFIDSVRKIVLDLGGDPSTIVFGPDTVSNNEVNYAGWYENLKSDGSSSMDIISRSIKHATVTINGRNYKFYRVYGQYGYTEQGTAGITTDNCLKEDPAGEAHPCGPDPHDLVYSTREALLDIVSLNNGSGNYTDVLDHLRAFFGDSSDLLQGHRFKGYGEALGYCNAGEDGADVDRCKDQKLLYELSDKFPNPGIHETTDIHHVSNYPDTTCQEGSGIPSYDPVNWVAGKGVYDETHQFGTDCYRSNFSYKGVNVHITNATYCFEEKEQVVEENISAALDDAAGDNDDIPTAEDNCPDDYNPNQEDGDCDGEGDACDASTDCTTGVDCDDDCDGFYNQNDNCQYFWNPSQADNDSDGIGNACDSNTDSDADGYGDTSAYENTCNRMWMAHEIPMGKNMCDNCPDTYNPNQKDSDRDGLGDCCDPSPGCGGNGEPTCDSYCEASTTTTADTTTTTTTIPCSLEAIYGEYSQKTELLRNFRDNVLSQSPEGQEIIRLYYEWSPMIVKAMEEDEEFKKGMKAMIDGVLLLIDNQVE